MNVREKIDEAIESGEVLKVTYLGGSQPGMSREITPISVAGDKLWAKCHASGTTKFFLIEKLVTISLEIFEATYGSHKIESPVSKYETITSFLDEIRDSMIGLGWHLESDDSWLSLHRIRKNGVPLKSSDVSINYDEFSSDLVVDENGDTHEKNERKRIRPWTVRGKEKDTKTLGSLDKAAGYFLEWAKILAPISKK